jgi:DedD protein
VQHGYNPLDFAASRRAMEPALKTRLLGAAVLIALAIIFVPMFFSGAPRKGANEQSVSLKIPDQPDAQVKTTTLSVGPDSASVNAGSNDPDHVATVDLDAGKPLPGSSAPAQQNAAVTPAQPAPATRESKRATPTPAPSGDVAQVPPPKAAPAPEPQPVSANPGAAANAVYAINLGTYAERGNADKLIAKLVKQGFAAHSENAAINGKPATRVVVGPFADRAAAEAARLKLKNAAPGVPLALVAGNTSQTADAPASALPAGRAGGWAVQLGAFGSEADANKLRDQLRTLGFDGYVDDVPSGKGGKLWRVRAGPVNERTTAEQLKSQIAQKMKISGIVVTQS